MSLNIMCAICSEFYKSSDTVYSTTACGHLFHQQCLFRWLKRSATCPQCRRICHRNRVHRVFLNFGERTAVDDELDAIVDDSPHWALLETFDRTATEPLPEGAIKSATDAEGNDLYVARVYFRDDLLPANYNPKKNGAHISYACHSHFVTEEIELLLDCDYKWVASADGHVPSDAIITGYTESGENLYTGRAQYNGITIPGKIHPSHGVLYMPFEEQEINVKEYEVLVRMPKATLSKQPLAMTMSTDDNAATSA